MITALRGGALKAYFSSVVSGQMRSKQLADKLAPQARLWAELIQSVASRVRRLGLQYSAGTCTLCDQGHAIEFHCFSVSSPQSCCPYTENTSQNIKHSG